MVEVDPVPGSPVVASAIPGAKTTAEASISAKKTAIKKARGCILEKLFAVRSTLPVRVTFAVCAIPSA